MCREVGGPPKLTPAGQTRAGRFTRRELAALETEGFAPGEALTGLQDPRLKDPERLEEEGWTAKRLTRGDMKYSKTHGHATQIYLVDPKHPDKTGAIHIQLTYDDDPGKDRSIEIRRNHRGEVYKVTT